MNILITGGAGFVGSHTAEAELDRGNSVIAMDIAPLDKVSHLMDNKNFKYIQGDVLSKDFMEPLIKKSDIVYHFAAIANVQTYCEHPLKVLNVNIDSLKVVAELCLKYEKKLVFSSSSEVYGKNLKVPWSEGDDRVLGPTTKHRWSYSTSKAVGEHYCFAYKELGLKMVICRFFNFYGRRLDFLGIGRVMPIFLGQFLSNKPVTVVEPGDQTRCFTYISDGIDGVLKAAHTKEAEGHIFNLGTNEEISIIDLAKKMKKVGNFDSEIVIVPIEKVYEKGYDDIFRRIPDIGKAKKILNFSPKVSLDEGLKKTIDWYKQHKEELK